MGSCDTHGLHRRILLLSVGITFLATPSLALLPGFQAPFVAFYLCAVAFMALHWWTLSGAIDSLFNDERTLAAVRGALSAFPALLALALIYVAARINRAFIVPAAIGIAGLAGAVSFICAARGIAGLASRKQERIDA